MSFDNKSCIIFEINDIKSLSSNLLFKSKSFHNGVDSSLKSSWLKFLRNEVLCSIASCKDLAKSNSLFDSANKVWTVELKYLKFKNTFNVSYNCCHKALLVYQKKDFD